MKFADFVNVASIKADLAADDKPAAIRELVESLAASGAISAADAPGIIAAISLILMLRLRVAEPLVIVGAGLVGLLLAHTK